ncbi:hypothetical protein CRENBAI_009275 [Crenichthys baileyi]|uniref:Dynein regulatory complex protein 1/2 N-terminal domain-containing protein n=1 Tax=Crenichthys baileyi TaxID=28760 RepID=A0AAV9RAG7_9TELE
MPKKKVKGKEATEEERLLQLQQRAQAEEEMAKKKEETLYLKDKLQKEERYASVNLPKVTESCRKNLHRARDAEHLKLFAVLQQKIERKLDEQNFIIQKMKRELQEADRRTDQVERCHLQQVEDLLGQRDRVLMNLEQQWDSSLQNLSSEMEKMRADFQQKNQQLVDLCLPAQMHDKGMCEGIEKLHQKVVDLKMNDQKYPEEMEEVNMGDRSVLKQQVLQGPRKSPNKLDKRMSSMQQIDTKDKGNKVRQAIPALEAENDLMEKEVTTGKDKLNQSITSSRTSWPNVARKRGRRSLTSVCKVPPSPRICRLLSPRARRFYELQSCATSCRTNRRYCHYHQRATHI